MVIGGTATAQKLIGALYFAASFAARRTIFAGAGLRSKYSSRAALTTTEPPRLYPKDFPSEHAAVHWSTPRNSVVVRNFRGPSIFTAPFYLTSVADRSKVCPMTASLIRIASVVPAIR